MLTAVTKQWHLLQQYEKWLFFLCGLCQGYITPIWTITEQFCKQSFCRESFCRKSFCNREVPAGRRRRELSVSLQGVRTSKDRSDTRHQGVRIECYVLIVITTGEVRNKWMWKIEWLGLSFLTSTAIPPQYVLGCRLTQIERLFTVKTLFVLSATQFRWNKGASPQKTCIWASWLEKRSMDCMSISCYSVSRKLIFLIHGVFETLDFFCCQINISWHVAVSTIRSNSILGGGYLCCDVLEAFATNIWQNVSGFTPYFCPHVITQEPMKIFLWNLVSGNLPKMY
jgi:hypothetical protein